MEKVSVITAIFTLFTVCTTSQQIEEQKRTSKNYVTEEANALNVPQEVFYYVSTESEVGFLENLHPSLIAFVKGNMSTSIDKIEGRNNEEGVVALGSSSCTVSMVTEELIEEYLENEKTYSGLVIKSITNQQPFEFSENQIVSVVLYSSKLKAFMDPYLNPVKKLKDDKNIPYIIVTMDIDNLSDIPDIFQNSVFD